MALGVQERARIDEAPERVHSHPSPGVLERLRAARRSARTGPLLVVSTSVALSLWVLRGERSYVEHLNDGAMHGMMVRWAQSQWAQGRVPLDGWMPDLSLGGPQFHHYQSIQHVVAGLLANIVGFETAFTGLLYVLLAAWPVSVYLGARWLGWERWASAGAAALAPVVVSLPGHGFEHGSYTWQGYGMWSQLFGMWLLPLAWGLSWQAICSGRRYILAAVVIAGSVATHFITSYLALVACGVWVLVEGRGLYARARRLVLVGALSLAVGSVVVVPLIVDARWLPQVEFIQDTIFTNSYGAGQVLAWLVSGEIYDAGRLPVVTVLVAVGLGVCVRRARSDARARALLVMWVGSFLLFSGRPTLGPLINLLPAGQDLFFHRFVSGMHLSGLLIAGVGLAAALGAARRLAARLVASRRRLALQGAAVMAVAALLLPAWIHTAGSHRDGRRMIGDQQEAEASDGADLLSLLALLPGLPEGRVFAGMRSGWGRDYRIGAVPVFAVLAGHDVDAVGFTMRTTALATAPEVLFDETNPAHYDLFGVRYVLTPAGRRPAVEAEYLGGAGRHRLWQVGNVGYTAVVATAGVITADRASLADASRALLAGLEEDQPLPIVAYHGEPAPAPTEGATAGGEEAGLVRSADVNLDNGEITTAVTANRHAAVLAKVSYHGRWSAEVDGEPTPTFMIAPALTGVAIPPGDHLVVMRYRPFPWYPHLVMLGMTVLVGAKALMRRRGVGGAMRPEDAAAFEGPGLGGASQAPVAAVQTEPPGESPSTSAAAFQPPGPQRSPAMGTLRGPAGAKPMVTVVLPCLNEAESVGACVAEAVDAIGSAGWTGEVVVVDNGSTDGSAEVAAAAGARVVREATPGYGAALLSGIRAAAADVVVMADADLTYDLTKIPLLAGPVLDGRCDLVLGERLSGATTETMPFLHRFVGTPILSLLVRRASGGLAVSDSQSGYRAFRKDSILGLAPQGSGMEFASEMLIRAARAGLRIEERPAGYRERVGDSKLNTFADGWRHLRLIMLLAPHLLLVLPGALVLAVGVALTIGTLVSPGGISIGGWTWQPVFVSGIGIVLGTQMLLAGVVIGHHSPLTSPEVARHYRFVGDSRFPTGCIGTGLSALAIGVGVDVVLFFVHVTNDGTAPRLAEPAAAMAQSFILVGATLAAFGFVYSIARRWSRG